jgi:hypothetical protein
MKKKDVIDLIRYHVSHNEKAFRDTATAIACEFNRMGDEQLAQFIMSQISDAQTFVVQDMPEEPFFLDKISYTAGYFPLPVEIKEDLVGILNAVSLNQGISKFFFYGPPGTGKTESAKRIAKLLNREIYSVNFAQLIDSKLGQTSKNIAELFKEIKSLSEARDVVILFDEFDSIAMDRTNSRDLREMGRVTSSVIKELDKLQNEVIIATSNLYESFDPAVIRRFDATVDFSRYSREDLIDISLGFVSNFLEQFGYEGKKNSRLFKKIVETQMGKIPYPGGLRNLIRKSIAFSDLRREQDYLRKFFQLVVPKEKQNPEQLKANGFSLREIELLTDISKSSAARILERSL